MVAGVMAIVMTVIGSNCQVIAATDSKVIETVYNDGIEYKVITDVNKGTITVKTADNDSSIITEDNIINGLNWMKENGVEYVNISLSSRKKCANLQKWINHNKDIKVYCCYNNKLNSFDYPAMCKNVIASGSLSKVKYKKCDRKYRSQEIIVFSGKKIQKFKGNSFLSIETILNDMEDKT